MYIKVSPERWLLLQRLMHDKPLPVWVSDMLALPLSEVVISLTGDILKEEGSFTMILVEEEIKPDYLDFLREQIALEPRGKEWTEVLKCRLSDIEPFINRPLLNFSLYHVNAGVCESCWVKLEPKTEVLVHYEVF